MAACAMVSMAEGEVEFCERIRLDQILITLEKLKIFDPHEGVEIFNDFSRKLSATPKEGHAEAVAAVKKVATDKTTAELIVRLCLAISLSDGKTSMVEQIEIVSLCSLLGVDANLLGLDMQKLVSTIEASDDIEIIQLPVK
ncbi:tellurite resistance TerB family protein [Methyloprofundus sp.]|uniref:tellurite resistance TerB family protein n=1 Tax=Methyloprofundus sp. TaxID=2020875 RepID=UPI003D0D00E5